jgi:hypothetical protein
MRDGVRSCSEPEVASTDTLGAVAVEIHFCPT